MWFTLFDQCVEALLTGMMANVSVAGEVPESFSVTNGVKQGCVLAPTLFSIFLSISAMLDEAFRNMGDGVYIESRQTADLYNVIHFRAKTTRILRRELLLADGVVPDRGCSLHFEHRVALNFAGKSHVCSTEISMAIGPLPPMGVQGKIYRAIVLSTLLYGPEAWTVYIRQVKKLHAFMMRHLRSIMRITWIDKVTNKDILERTGLPSMENLRWTGHLMRMSPDRLPKQVLYSQLSSEHRKRGLPRFRFKDTFKRNLKLRDINTDSSLSQQKDKWRATVK